MDPTAVGGQFGWGKFAAKARLACNINSLKLIYCVRAGGRVELFSSDQVSLGICLFLIELDLLWL